MLLEQLSLLVLMAVLARTGFHLLRCAVLGYLSCHCRVKHLLLGMSLQIATLLMHMAVTVSLSWSAVVVSTLIAVPLQLLQTQ